MKKLIYLLIMLVMITSCQTTYNSRNQHKNMCEFQHSKYKKSGKRGDIYHPAVTKQTRKRF